MPKLGKHATAIISIYDAANDSEGWNSALDACVNYVRAHSANILFHETEKDSRWRYSLGSQKWRNCNADKMARTIALFEKYDAQAWNFVHMHQKQKLFIDTDFWGDAARLDDREDYQFFRRELGFLRKVGSKLNDNRCWTDNIAFQFPASMQQVPPKSLSRIQKLLPHAAKSIELWRTFSILKSKYQAVLSALDHVKVGMCIAEPGGTIIVANSEAQRILELGSAIRIGRDKLIHCRSAKKENIIRESV